MEREWVVACVVRVGCRLCSRGGLALVSREVVFVERGCVGACGARVGWRLWSESGLVLWRESALVSWGERGLAFVE